MKEEKVALPESQNNESNHSLVFGCCNCNKTFTSKTGRTNHQKSCLLKTANQNRSYAEATALKPPTVTTNLTSQVTCKEIDNSSESFENLISFAYEKINVLVKKCF